MNAREPAEPPQRHLSLDIHVGTHPLTGVLYADEVAYPFEGWLALASALGRLVEGDADLPPAV